MRIPRISLPRFVPRVLLFVAALGLTVAVVEGQRAAAAGTPQAPRTVRWTVVSPDAALAWFNLLADLRLPGAGAFPFTESSARTTEPELARTLGRSRDSEFLHFVPLYNPSADRAALAAAVRAAAVSPVQAPTPRAALLVGALAQSLPAELRRDQLPALAAALERRRPVAPAAELLAAWQRELDARYLPALAPWLVLERLDAGRLIVAPGIGSEGRIFAGTQDRADNLVAVGDFAKDPDAEAPLLAFVREICFSAVTRATNAATGFDARDADGARRASLAAVRCGAALLDMRLPERADAYRAFWLRRAAGAGMTAAVADVPLDPAARRGAFDRAFPADPALAASLARALARLPEAP